MNGFFEWEPGCSNQDSTHKIFSGAFAVGLGVYQILSFDMDRPTKHPNTNFLLVVNNVPSFNFVFGYPQNMEIPWVSTKNPPQQPHIICHSGNTASGANVSVPKGMRSSSLANFVEWQAIFFRVYTPENLPNT